MQKTLLALSVAVGIGLVGSQSAGAVPASAPAVKEAAPVSVLLRPAQYIEHRTRHGVAKCYRDFVVGPYRCHYYRNP